MRRLIDNDSGYWEILAGFALLLLLLSSFCLNPLFFGTSIDKTGILESTFLDKDNYTISIRLSDGTEYNSIFTSKETTVEYYYWLNTGIDRTISFSYQKGGWFQLCENDFSSPQLYLEKNTTIEQVIYKEGGLWWWEKPPVRVVLGDGSNFIFYGSDDDKFSIYSEFIVYEDQQVIVHYLEEYNGDTEFDYIES